MGCDPEQPPEEVANPPRVRSPQGGTILITNPEDLRCVTAREETDAIGAMRRGLREYLARASKDVLGVRVQFTAVYEEWAEPEDDAVQYPAAAVLMPAPVAFDASSLTPQIRRTPLPDGRYLAKMSEAATEFTIEAHSSSPGERSAVAMLLEDAFNPVDWMSGFRLELPHYFGERAEFEILSADWRDDATSVRHGLRPISTTIAGRISVVRPRVYPLARIKIEPTVDDSTAPVVRVRKRPHP